MNFSEWQRPQEKSSDTSEELLDGEMPPALYRLMHAHAQLSNADRNRLARGLAKTFGHFITGEITTNVSGLESLNTGSAGETS